MNDRASSEVAKSLHDWLNRRNVEVRLKETGAKSCHDDAEQIGESVALKAEQSNRMPAHCFRA